MSNVRTFSDNVRDPGLWARALLPAAIAVGAIALAVIAAFIIGRENDIDAVNGFVELLSGRSGSALSGLAGASFLFAFAAGMASAVNPCGFAMLPAYLGLYLRANNEEAESPNIALLFGRAVLIGSVVTVGFIVLFGVAGTAIGLGASVLVDALPWTGLFVGILLVSAGAWIVAGGKLYSGLAARAASHIGEGNEVGVKGYFLFGLSYGVASLGCTLPIFLAVLGVNTAGVGLLESAGQFLLYALGMGSVIMALTLGMAFFKGAVVKGLRKALPYVQPIGAGLMIVAGVYIIFYWLTLGGLRQTLGF